MTFFYIKRKLDCGTEFYEKVFPNRGDIYMEETIQQRILSEALFLVNTQGADFHIDELAKRLHISKRTVYEHFTSKQDIIWQSLVAFADELYREHKALLEDTTLPTDEKMMKFFQMSSRQAQVFSVRHMNVWLSRVPEVRKKLRIMVNRDWEILELLVAQGQDEGIFRTFDISLFMHLVKNAAADILDYMDEMEHEYSFFSYMTKCLDMLLYGIKVNGRMCDERKPKRVDK
ncbi:transcriptional regulator, TetR family [Megasphaera hutchinsoni]|uniref:Transcriptional regulator, TetR family n=2 Tax=Megasphaera hutchinsoni TaxID=1588748 RepID=A0A134CF89_9FIRM|nr:transcriptional regulator, TetR family [Megasphaera hutchinsoni]